jgi:CBS domain containing-hemolysin-like protein
VRLRHAVHLDEHRQDIQIVKKDSPRIDGRVPARNVFKAIDTDEDDIDSVL